MPERSWNHYRPEDEGEDDRKGRAGGGTNARVLSLLRAVGADRMPGRALGGAAEGGNCHINGNANGSLKGTPNGADTVPTSMSTAAPGGRARTLFAGGEDPGDAARRLAVACHALSPDMPRGVVADLRRGGIDAAGLIDRFIPDAARLLGEDWSNNRLSFAQVTIGVARLHTLLRDVEADTLDHAQAPIDCPHVALIVRAAETHTLGASVAACQLRRAGVSVDLVFGRDDDDIVRHVCQNSHDMLMISSSGRSSGRDVAPLVAKLRARARVGLPIALGGPILATLDEGLPPDGVDHAMCDPIEALCGAGLAPKSRRAG